VRLLLEDGRIDPCDSEMLALSWAIQGKHAACCSTFMFNYRVLEIISDPQYSNMALNLLKLLAKEEYLETFNLLVIRIFRGSRSVEALVKLLATISPKRPRVLKRLKVELEVYVHPDVFRPGTIPYSDFIESLSFDTDTSRLIFTSGLMQRNRAFLCLLDIFKEQDLMCLRTVLLANLYPEIVDLNLWRLASDSAFASLATLLEWTLQERIMLVTVKSENFPLPILLALYSSGYEDYHAIIRWLPFVNTISALNFIYHVNYH